MTAALDDVLVSFDVNRQRLFQAHLFMIINTLVHEIGHVFITYLTEGREETTPPNINALAQDVPGDNGEAGLALECLIFGGTINYFRDPIGGNSDDQVCSQVPTVALVKD